MKGRVSPRLKKKLGESAVIALCLSPSAVLILVFTYFSFFYCIYLSFHSWNILSPKRFIGLENYISAFSSPDFLNALRVTFIYVAAAVPPCVILGMVAGLLLNWISHAKSFFRLMLFLPFIISMVAASTVWRMVLHPGAGGFLNHILFSLGFKASHWTNWWNDTQGGAIASVVIVGVWKFVGYNGVLFLAGLKNIDKSLYEAAKADGANPWQKFFRITFPLLSPTTFLVTMLQLISAFKVVESIMIMTGGGPADSTMALVLYIYNNAFSYLKFGYACAVSAILFGIILLVTVVQLILEKRMVHYQ
ncbi:MAG: sugar ABC transporter permease [Treponema sp.]|jgi:multiple sugar transport system permease protein|nr:sugar ABC transporter permease [Treponema sp.]